MGWWGRTETVGKGRAASESIERALPAHLAAMLARPERTAEEDIALARWLIKHGDFAAALRHLAPPIAADPEKLEWLEVIDDWIATAGPDAIDHFPPEGECSVGENILRAYVLAARDEFLPALAALQAVQSADPQARCLDVWGLAWLDSDKVLRSIPRQQLDDMLAQIPVRYPEFRELRAAEREPLLRLLRVLQRFAKLCEPNTAELILRSQCLRKVGQYDEAYNLARQVYLQEPGYASSVTLAMVLRVGGHTKKAVNAFQVALRHRPHDVPVLIELGDIQFDAERWQDAAHWYELAVKSDPQNAWATASLCYCRLQLTADAEWEKRLARMARGCAPTDRASCLHRRTMPYAGFLPERVGPVADLLRELVPKGCEVLAKELPKRYRLKVHDVEAPSVRLAFDQQMESMGIDCRLELQVGHIRTPDPRRPIGVVQHALWRYEGDIAYPSLPAPGEDVARGIARLARQPYDPERNWRMAGVVAEAVGIQRADELMSVMVCPPPLPADMNTLVWIPRVQLAAAQTLAQTDTAWEGSMRRQMLFDMTLGPVDWTTEMAIIAICQLIQREPAIYDDVRKVFQELLQHFRSATDDPYRLALLTNWLAIPTLPTEERRQLTELLIPLKTK